MSTNKNNKYFDFSQVASTEDLKLLSDALENIAKKYPEELIALIKKLKQLRGDYVINNKQSSERSDRESSDGSEESGLH